MAIDFFVITIVIIICNILLLSLKKIQKYTKKYHELDKNLQTKLKIFQKFNKVIIFIVSTILAPLISFFKKNGVLIALSILSFIFLFKIGEAFLGRMSVLFYKEIGFSKSDIGIFSKALGWITTIIFTLIGGFLTIKTGIFRSLFVAGIFMAFTNLLFALLAWTGKSYLIFSIAVILTILLQLLLQLRLLPLYLYSLIETILQRNMLYSLQLARQVGLL